MLSKLSESDASRLIEMSERGTSLSEICRVFGISESTAERYKYGHLRELSRKVQRKKYQEDVKNCFECGKPWEGHARCVICKRTIHDFKDGKDKCASCIGKGK